MEGVNAAVVPKVVDKLISVFGTDALAMKAPTGGDNIKTPAGASVISIVISDHILYISHLYRPDCILSDHLNLSNSSRQHPFSL